MGILMFILVYYFCLACVYKHRGTATTVYSSWYHWASQKALHTYITPIKVKCKLCGILPSWLWVSLRRPLNKKHCSSSRSKAPDTAVETSKLTANSLYPGQPLYLFTANGTFCCLSFHRVTTAARIIVWTHDVVRNNNKTTIMQP